MKQLYPVNFKNTAHAQFLYTLAQDCREDVLDDYCPDILLFLECAERSIDKGITIAFLCLDEDKAIGVVWAEVDSKRVGLIHIGMLKEYRQGLSALHYLRLFVDTAFTHLNIRKLECHLPTDRKPAEKLLKRLGFRKFGLRQAATMVNGQPEHHVLLGLLQEDRK